LWNGKIQAKKVYFFDFFFCSETSAQHQTLSTNQASQTLLAQRLRFFGGRKVKGGGNSKSEK
jgi:hypothetical protein